MKIRDLIIIQICIWLTEINMWIKEITIKLENYIAKRYPEESYLSEHEVKQILKDILERGFGK